MGCKCRLQNDIKIGNNIVGQLSEIFKKTRNTARFLLGNLFDFDPAVDYVEYKDLLDIDKFALNRLSRLIKNVDEALAIVKFTPKASSEIIEKLLKSAIANAENNHGLDSKNLYIAEIYANQGPTLKRIRPAAKGSAVRIRKRTSHITIVLKERV